MTTIDPNHQPVPSTHVDIGGVALPREELANVLPDIERFEAHLADALAVDSYMKNDDGSIPDYVRQWPEERVQKVVDTLKEIGSLREQLSEQARSGAAGEQANSSTAHHSFSRRQHRH